MAILEGKGLKKYYNEGKKSEVRALDGISLSVNKGELIAIVGTSGSGKSTLLHMLSGLDKLTSGSIIIDGNQLINMSEENLTIFRRRNIGFVFQNYNLVPILNVYENIVLPIELDGDILDKQYMEDILNILGIKDKIYSLPNDLSGGQKQRVAIARALITKPSIIFADEPTGNLDSKTEKEVLGLLKYTSKKYSQTIIMITHNEAVAQMADRIIRIEDGKVVGGKI